MGDFVANALKTSPIVKTIVIVLTLFLAFSAVMIATDIFVDVIRSGETIAERWNDGLSAWIGGVWRGIFGRGG